MILSKQSQNHVNWTPENVKIFQWIEKQTFLLFVKFGEKLCSKRFDPKDQKNTLFGLLKA